MTLAEFKAWFEGFSEGIDTVPTEAQFAKIKDKVSKIDGTVTTYPVFVDRYWPSRLWLDGHIVGYPNQPYGWGGPIWAQATGGVTPLSAVSGQATQTFGQFSYAHVEPSSKGDNVTVEFNAQEAFRSLGRAEAVN